AIDAEGGKCPQVRLDAGAAARVGAGDGQRDRRCHGRVARIHSLARASGLAFSVMSVTTETTSAPAFRHSFARSGLRPPMATSGTAPRRRFQSPIRLSPCGAKAIAFRIVG